MSHLTKYTANYRCPDDINNFKLSVKLAEVKNSKDFRQQQHQQKCVNFKWQEKKFSRFERELYKNEDNCVTDLEKKYHLDVVQLPDTEIDQIDVYSYTHEDDYFCNKIEDAHTENDEIEEENEEFDLNKSIRKCLQLHNVEKTIDMAIMADLGEYVENTWIKQEIILCLIRYDPNCKILKIYPDFNQFQPYTIVASSRTFQYFIENTSETSLEHDRNEKELIQKINAQKSVLRRQIVDLPPFSLPEKHQLDIHLFLEILWAKNFEYDAIRVEYFVDLPENWSCSDRTQLEGVTQTCYGKTEEGVAHFSHSTDLHLHCNINQEVFQCPYIYFSVVSKDTWDRYRTEGLAYKTLPISKPGLYHYELQCFRLLPQNFTGQLRRFFIGDNFSNISLMGLPRNHTDSILNRYGTHTVGTGELGLRFNVILQSSAFGDGSTTTHCDIFDKLNASSLVKSVEQVLQAFQRAKSKMIQARMKIE